MLCINEFVYSDCVIRDFAMNAFKLYNYIDGKRSIDKHQETKTHDILYTFTQIDVPTT